VHIRPNIAGLNEVLALEHYKGRPTGAVSALAIEEGTGALTRRGDQPSEGGAPCFVSVDRSGRALLVANYAGGSVALLSIQMDYALAPAASVVQHPREKDRTPSVRRRRMPTASFRIPPTASRSPQTSAPTACSFIVSIWTANRCATSKAGTRYRPGAGPRHIAFHPTLPLVFVANELDSTVAMLRFDSTRGTLSPQDTRSTVPAGWTGTNYPADIHVASNGRTLYVSNRGHNSIAVFSVAESTGALALDQVVSTEGDWPRNFSLDPSGRWLPVANQRSDSVVVFGRDPDNGRLTPTHQRIAIPSPVCLRFA